MHIRTRVQGSWDPQKWTWASWAWRVTDTKRLAPDRGTGGWTRDLDLKFWGVLATPEPIV